MNTLLFLCFCIGVSVMVSMVGAIVLWAPTKPDEMYPKIQHFDHVIASSHRNPGEVEGTVLAVGQVEPETNGLYRDDGSKVENFQLREGQIIFDKTYNQFYVGQQDGHAVSFAHEAIGKDKLIAANRMVIKGK